MPVVAAAAQEAVWLQQRGWPGQRADRQAVLELITVVARPALAGVARDIQSQSWPLACPAAAAAPIQRHAAAASADGASSCQKNLGIQAAQGPRVNILTENAQANSEPDQPNITSARQYQGLSTERRTSRFKNDKLITAIGAVWLVYEGLPHEGVGRAALALWLEVACGCLPETEAKGDVPAKRSRSSEDKQNPLTAKD